jgi:pyruvate/2-oxoglutarate dehydrogenase complex dihydrolipoamide dehydrogenase (E3) component
MGLEAAGVRFDPRRGIEVDDRLRTTNHRVFAVGDVNGAWAFTHAADAQARTVVQNALFFGRSKLSELIVPWATYTSPEVAHVGITAGEAARRVGEVEAVTIRMAEVDRARLDGETEGFLRVYLARGSDRILGATLVAEHAGEVIGHLTTAMVAGIGLERLGSTIFPYPTQAEAIRKAADAWRRRKLTPRVKRGFEWFFRVMR